MAPIAAASGGGGLSAEEKLGRALYLDQDLSLRRNQSCESCHSLSPAIDPATGRRLPALGFVDNDNVRRGTAVSDGSVHGAFGSLNAPSVGYAAFSPFFHFDGAEGLYVGGQFWNGRVRTLAEQAAQPFLNPVEMAMPSRWAVVTRIKEKRSYVRAFEEVYGIDLDWIPGFERAPSQLKPPPGVLAAYDATARAIAAFEKTRFFNRFNSKFDFVQAGRTSLSDEEQLGLALFVGKAQCSACHPADTTIAPGGGAFPPLFTDFTYDNLGAPRNVKIPGNPEPNPGLGGRPDIAARDPEGAELGKHKVMSLRNIALTPPYGHNGVFTTLEQIVHFYNTRDTLGHVPDNRHPGFGITGWPAPEVPQNVNTDELGNLGLSADEERAVVAFLLTLTDDYPEWGRDPNVPRGTPSPYAETPFPPLP